MSSMKQRVFGHLYPALVKARHSRAARLVEGSVILPRQLMRMRYNRPVFSVDIAGRMGLGATLAIAIVLYKYAETRGRRPQIIATNPLYAPSPGSDCLAAYLGESQSAVQNLRPLPLTCYEDLWFLRMDRHVPLPDASRIFRDYLSPSPALKKLVHEAVAGGPNFDVSVHFRGTDKALEVKPASWDAVAEALRLHEGRRARIFLATDDAAFEAWFYEQHPHAQIVSYSLASDVSGPRHFSEMTPEQKTQEALVNMFLLASARVCIRTASYMSAMSKVINPGLRTVTLNSDPVASRLFPEFEVISAE